MGNRKPGENVLVVFDVGGTLADLNALAMRSLHEMCPHLRGMVWSEIVEVVARDHDSYSMSVFDLDIVSMSALVAGHCEPAAALDAYRSRVLDGLRSIVLPRRVFCTLRGMGARIAVATNGTIDSTGRILGGLGVDQDVADRDRYVSEAFGVLKSTGVIHSAIREDNSALNIVCVGDSIVEDLRPAVLAQMRPVWMVGFLEAGVLLGAPPPETMRIRSIAEVPEIVAGQVETTR